MELGRIFGEIRKRALKKFGGSLSVAIVFGSATRPEDFVHGLSDIDLILVLNNLGGERNLWEEIVEGLRVSAVVLSRAELERMAELGSPLAIWARRF